MKKLMEQLNDIENDSDFNSEFDALYSELESLVYDFNTLSPKRAGYLIENLEAILVKYGKFGD